LPREQAETRWQTLEMEIEMAMLLTTRRDALAALAGFAALSAAARAEQTPPGAAHPVTSGLTADEALEVLKRGNAEFLNDASGENHKRRVQLAEGQSPFAVLVGCSDSRVSPELLFGRGLGELFIVRVAGNTVGLSALGTIEYALAQLGVPLVIVLGHERCGAVKAAVEVVNTNATFPGRISDMVEPIIPAVLAAQDMDGDLLSNAVIANVRRVVSHIIEQSPIVREGMAAGKVKVVGAVYDLDEGHVTFLDAT
jgi:carbonic anhydrase